MSKFGRSGRGFGAGLRGLYLVGVVGVPTVRDGAVPTVLEGRVLLLLGVVVGVVAHLRAVPADCAVAQPGL